MIYKPYKGKRFELKTLYASHAGYGWRNEGSFDTMEEVEEVLLNHPQIVQDFNVYDSVGNLSIHSNY